MAVVSYPCSHQSAGMSVTALLFTNSRSCVELLDHGAVTKPREVALDEPTAAAQA